MKRQDFRYISKDGRNLIHGVRWMPEGEVKGILQISHGMVDFIDKYEGFASFLADNGILVTGNDHLGHGGTVAKEEDFGYFSDKNGNECVIGDMHTLYKLTKKLYPDLPYFMAGHSMGSFLVRQYITLYGRDLKGAILIGTGDVEASAVKVAKKVALKIMLKKGGREKSDLLDDLTLRRYSNSVKDRRTSDDWLTRDEKIVDKFLEHPWNNFRFTANAYYHMFRGIGYADDKKNMKRIPKDLPVIFLSGEDDPVGSYGKGVIKVYNRFMETGLKDVDIKLYPGDRHEILNELDRDDVYNDILVFIREKGLDHEI